MVVRRRLLPLLAASWALLTVTYVAWRARAASVDDSACAGSSNAYVHVSTARHELTLCESGHAQTGFRVRLGKHGVGKTREGDEKTPLGTYALGPPQPSSAFGVFMAIGYPTADQRAKGYTGSAVGIHGPRREVRWAGWLVNLFDTTDGCVGLATDDEMNRVASWARRTHAAKVVLE